MSISRAFAAGGFVAGMALAGVGILLAPEAVGTPQATTSTTSLATPTTGSGPWWFSPAETVLGPTALLVDEITFEDGDVVVRYQLRDLAPPALGRLRTLEESNPFFAQPREEPVLAPERWVLETVDGEYEGFSPSARAPIARFDVPDQFVLATITGLRLESYRMRMPYVYEIELAPVAGTRVELDEGFTVEVLRVLPQTDSTIIHVDLETPSDDFTAGEPAPAILQGVGVEWATYGPRQAGGQFGGQQLVRRGGELPDVIRLQVRTTYWVQFDSTIPIDLGGIRRG